jgi:hypothetical protein
MWKLIPKVTLVIIALLPALACADGNDGFERDNARNMLRRRRLFYGGKEDFSIFGKLAKKYDRELILTEKEIGEIQQLTQTMDDRELGIFSTIIQGLGSLFGGSSSEELQQLTENMNDRQLGLFSTIASALGSLFGGASSLTEEQIQKLSEDMNDRQLSIFSSLFRVARRYGPRAISAIGNAVGGGDGDDGGYDRELILTEKEIGEIQQLTQTMDDRELGIFSTIIQGLGSLFGGSSSEELAQLTQNMDDRELGLFSTIASALGSLFGGSSSLTEDQLQQLSQNMNDRELSIFSSLFHAAEKYGPKVLKDIGSAVGGGSNDDGANNDGGNSGDSSYGGGYGDNSV